MSRSQLRAERERLLLVRESNRKSQRASLRQLNREAKRFTRNRRRVRMVRLVIFGSLGALVLVVLATVFTPLLAISKIEVTGTSRLDKKVVETALKPQLGVALTLVDTSKIAAELKGFSLIESFSVLAMPPHTLQVRIIERQPVSMVTIGGVNYVFDVAGINLGRARATDEYPVVSIAGNPKSSASYANAMQVLLALPIDLVQRIAVVEAKSQDNVVLQLKGLAGQQILWGDKSDSTLKAKVLAALIKHVPKNRTATIDVSAPTAAVVRYGN